MTGPMAALELSGNLVRNSERSPTIWCSAQARCSVERPPQLVQNRQPEDDAKETSQKSVKWEVDRSNESQFSGVGSC